MQTYVIKIKFMKITLNELRRLIKTVIKEQDEKKVANPLEKEHEQLTGILFDIHDLLKDYMGSDELDMDSKNDLHGMFKDLNTLLRTLINESKILAGNDLMMQESFKYKKKLIIESLVSDIITELNSRKMELIKSYYYQNWSEYNNALHGIGNWMTYASTKLIPKK
jgi:hypothetical protein